MNQGIVFAVITVFLWALCDVLTRFFGVYWGVNPFVFVSFMMFFASLSLLFVAGRGSLAKETIKNPYTWAFSCVSLLMDITGVFVFLLISVTEATLMMRLSIIITALICRFGIKRKIELKTYIGFAFIFIGFFIVASNLEEVVRFKAVCLIFLIALGQSFRTYFSEVHPTSNKAILWKDNCRVSGVIILITSLFFIFTGIIMAPLRNYLAWVSFVMPSLDDFINLKTILAALLAGCFNVSFSSYFYFQATKRIGADVFLMVGSCLPIFAYILEKIASNFGLLEITSVTYNDFVAFIFIIFGASWCVFIKIREKRKTKIYG